VAQHDGVSRSRGRSGERLYGKARVQGRLFGEDINQLTNRGIPIIQELAKQFGVSDSEVKKLVASGEVGFPAIEKAFVSLTSEGGKFAGMMEAQSKTTTGLFSTLKDTVNEVFLTLGQPINDAIRPLIAEGIGLVQKLVPLAAEAGAAIKDTIQVVIAAFKSGQLLELVASALSLGYAIAANTLVNGLRTAVEFFWNLITDGAMWKSLGTTLLGLVAGFGAALLNAFQTPIVYLQAGMEWVVAHLLKGLLKIPGMSDLLGIEADYVQTDFDKILKERKETGAELFGFNMKELAEQADGLLGEGPATAATTANQTTPPRSPPPCSRSSTPSTRLSGTASHNRRPPSASTSRHPTTAPSSKNSPCAPPTSTNAASPAPPASPDR
jgi:tape measure domain-containing protein